MQVECRSDYAYAGAPLALWWLGERLVVKDILSEWRVPEGKGFRVMVEDDRIFDLMYNEPNDEWIIHLL